MYILCNLFRSDMADCVKLPAAVILDIKPFKAQVGEEKLQLFKKLLELSPIAPAVFEKTNTGRRYGMKRVWLRMLKRCG